MAIRITRQTVAASVGTALEWYDFALYGTMSAIVLPAVFFPSGNATLATLASLATFAVGFFARPIGGVIIGILGDRLGRRQVLLITLLLMGIASTLIGVIPPYAKIGVLSPILLVIFRILQGLGAGGEYAGALLFSAEHAGGRARSMNASIPSVGNALGSLASTGVFLLLVTLLPRDAFTSYGWRIAFLISIIVAVVGIIIRLRVTDSPEYLRAKSQRHLSGFPLMNLLRSSGRRIPIGMMISVAPNVISYLPSVYALTYLANSVGAPSWVGVSGIAIANAIKIVTLPTAGWLCDRFGRRPIMMIGSVAAAALFYPFFFMLDTGTPVVIWVALVLIFTLCNDLTLASQAAVMSDLFDVEHRFTGVTFSREIVGAIVGGSIPYVAARLLDWSGGAVGILVAFCAALCLVSTVGAYFLPRPVQLYEPDMAVPQ